MGLLEGLPPKVPYLYLCAPSMTSKEAKFQGLIKGKDKWDNEHPFCMAAQGVALYGVWTDLHWRGMPSPVRELRLPMRRGTNGVAAPSVPPSPSPNGPRMGGMLLRMWGVMRGGASPVVRAAVLMSDVKSRGYRGMDCRAASAGVMQKPAGGPISACTSQQEVPADL